MTRRTAKRPAVRVRWELEEYTLGVDAHIDPANCTDFTKIQYEFAGTQWGDVGIAPYANLESCLQNYS